MQLPRGSGGNDIVGHPVIAPSILFEGMELDRREADWPKPPFVTPPGLSLGIVG